MAWSWEIEGRGGGPRLVHGGGLFGRLVCTHWHAHFDFDLEIDRSHGAHAIDGSGSYLQRVGTMRCRTGVAHVSSSTLTLQFQ